MFCGFAYSQFQVESFFHSTAFFSLCLEQEADLMELDNYEFVQFFLEVIEISLLAVW